MSSSRSDGRTRSQLRPMSATLGQLDRADGSALFAFGGTQALASVSGPIEAGLREELPDKATLRIVHRPLEGVAATPSKALVNTLQAIFPPLLSLGQHPRSLIQLVVQSISPDPASNTTEQSGESQTWPPETFSPLARSAPMSGSFFSTRAAALNAAALALIDTSSVAMRAVPVGVAVTINADGEVLVDPNMEEEDAAVSRHVFGWAFGTGIAAEGAEKEGMDVDGAPSDRESELVWAESEGDFSRQDYETAQSAAKQAASDILSFYRETISEHLSSHLKTRVGQ